VEPDTGKDQGLNVREKAKVPALSPPPHTPLLFSWRFCIAIPFPPQRPSPLIYFCIGAHTAWPLVEAGRSLTAAACPTLAGHRQVCKRWNRRCCSGARRILYIYIYITLESKTLFRRQLHRHHLDSLACPRPSPQTLVELLQSTERIAEEREKVRRPAATIVARRARRLGARRRARTVGMVFAMQGEFRPHSAGRFPSPQHRANSVLTAQPFSRGVLLARVLYCEDEHRPHGPGRIPYPYHRANSVLTAQGEFRGVGSPQRPYHGLRPRYSQRRAKSVLTAPFSSRGQSAASILLDTRTARGPGPGAVRSSPPVQAL
jgi:hypothetical protein